MGSNGVRKGFLIYQYKDLETSGDGFWWDKSARYFNCCKSSLEKAISFIKEESQPKEKVKEEVLNYKEFEKQMVKECVQSPLEELKELLNTSLKPDADIIRINFLLDLIKK